MRRAIRNSLAAWTFVTVLVLVSLVVIDLRFGPEGFAFFISSGP
jgi:hypothetical protein